MTLCKKASFPLGNPTDKKQPQEDHIRQLGWTLHDVFRLLQRNWHRRLRDSGIGISPAQSRVLAEVHQQGGLTQTALAESVEMEKAPLGRLLDRMEELGLIERKPAPDDRRARLVFHTAKAESMDEPMWGVARGMFEAALNGISPAEYDTLLALLDRMKQNLLLEEGRDAAMRSPNDTTDEPAGD